jgi:hypothetical protein
MSDTVLRAFWVGFCSGGAFALVLVMLMARLPIQPKDKP